MISREDIVTRPLLMWTDRYQNQSEKPFLFCGIYLRRTHLSLSKSIVGIRGPGRDSLSPGEIGQNGPIVDLERPGCA